MKRILIAVFFAIALTGVVHAQTGIQLNWNAPAGYTATGYVVLRAPTTASYASLECNGCGAVAIPICGSVPYFKIAVLGAITSYIDPSSHLAPSTGYCYKVGALLGPIRAWLTGPVSVLTPSTWTPQPAPPGNLAAVSITNQGPAVPGIEVVGQ